MDICVIGELKSLIRQRKGLLTHGGLIARITALEFHHSAIDRL